MISDNSYRFPASSCLLFPILALRERYIKANRKKKEDIDFIIDMKPDFIQFVALGAMPGTALYHQYKEEGRILDVPYEEWHGQSGIWFQHPSFTPERSDKILKMAFRRDFHTLGPSIFRITRTQLKGYLYSKNRKEWFHKKRKEIYRKRLLQARLIIPAMKLYAPNYYVKNLIQELKTDLKK